MKGWVRRALFLCAVWVLSGCAAQTFALRAQPPADLPSRVELTATPFFSQTEYHCGPAALATVLAAIDRPADPSRLAEQVFLPARTGTLQIEMIAGARRQGAVATRLPPTLDALLRELHAGHPVVVLQNLGLSWYSAWHYAVLVGYDLEAGELLLRSGTEPRQVMSMRTFEHTWVRAGSWGFAALPPGQWPMTAEESAVVDAAVGFERVVLAESPSQAVTAYRTALQRHPGSLSLAMGLGNSLYASDQRAAAADMFRQAAQRHHSAPAWINLAATLQDLGALIDAEAAARAAVSLDDPLWKVPADAALARVLAARRGP